MIFKLIIIILLLLIIHPTDRKLIYCFIVGGGLPQEYYETNYTGLPRVSKHVGNLCLKIGIMVGLFLYPIGLLYYFGGSLGKLWYFLRRPLSYPMLEGGGIYSLFDYNLRYGHVKMDGGKRFWNRYFEENKILTPQVFQVIDSGSKFLPDRDFLTKPDLGKSGTGIEFYKFREDGTYLSKRNKKYSSQSLLSKLKSEKKSILLMELIKANKSIELSEYPQSFRLLTAKSKSGEIKLLSIRLTVQKSNTLIATNSSRKDREIYYLDLEDLTFRGKTVPWMDLAISQAKKMHKDFDYFSIAWDIIIANRGPYFLEGNFGHVILADPPTYDRYYQKTIEYLDLYEGKE